MPGLISDTEPQGSATVILTGSTGSLGSYLLDSLIQQNHIRKIYALNRAEDGQAKQQESSQSRGLGVNWPTEKVEFLQAQLSEPEFGLDEKKYAQLLRETTDIIHCQWPVNFNWDLSSFEPHVKGVRHLLDFCLDTPRPEGTHMLFLSTLGTVSQLDGSDLVAETPNHVLTPDLAGYYGSKLVCELIIEEHVKNSPGQKASICRVGQIAGPVYKHGGMWNKQEWIPSLLESSKKMGCLPSNIGAFRTLSWVPVDYLADVIVELAGLDGSSSANEDNSTVQVYHAVNPHALHWEDLTSTIAAFLKIPSDKVVPWSQWVEALRKCEGTDGMETIPGLKLLDFYSSLDQENGGTAKEMPLVSTKNATARSKTLAALEPVGKEWMTIWLKQWNLMDE